MPHLLALPLVRDAIRCFGNDPAPPAPTPIPAPPASGLPPPRRAAAASADDPAATAARRRVRIGDFKLNVQVPFTTKKPKDPLLYIATGGTISATGSRHTYEAGKLAGKDCLRGVRLPHNVDVEVVDLFAKDSKDIEAQDWRSLRDLVLRRIGSVRGVVVSHGSDTLALTAQYLQLTLPPATLAGKKVVLTGAMKPASDPRPDGPGNLSDAFHLARSRRGQGVLATLAGRIYAPPGFAKKHTTSVQAFQPLNAPPVGTIRHGKVSITHPPEPPPRTFEPGDAKELPVVHTFHSEPGVAPARAIAHLRRAFDEGAQGIVYAGTGNGTVHHAVESELSRLAAEGRLVVRSSGTGDGEVIRNGAFPDDRHGVACSGRLAPDQARLLAQLALADAGQRAAANGTAPDVAAVRSVFDAYQSPRVTG
jgi:L-asparaginase